MPGIAGMIGGAAGRAARVDGMLGRMAHEAFYATGRLGEPRLGADIGWACIRGSFCDCLPIWNAARDRCLIFWGEHYPSASDTAAGLMAMWEESGEGFLPRLNGVFSGVMLDLREGKVTLFNDRYGLGRIYWRETTDGLYFASEAKALLRALPDSRRLDARGFAERLACGCALQDRTIFNGVSLLPPGSAWTFRPGAAVKKENYFRRETWENPAPISEEEYFARLREVFGRVAPRYFNGRLPVGLSLTGGLDSRMVVAEADRALPCYTFAGALRESADVRVGRQVAEICGQPFQTIGVGAEFLPQFGELAARSVYYSDGAMDVTGAVELFANRRARKIAPVRLTGNYGSEILRGNIAFRPEEGAGDGFAADLAAGLGEAAATYAEERRAPRASFIAFCQTPWHHYGRVAVEQSQLVVRSPFLDNELTALAYQAPADAARNEALSLRLIAARKPALSGVPTDRGRAKPALAPAKLWRFGRELLPRAEYAYDYGMPQWFAKVDRALRPLHLERLFLGRQKFAHFRTWYANELAGVVKQTLLDPRALGRSHVDRKRVEQIVGEHTGGGGNHTLAIHRLLTVEWIFRELLEA